MVDVAKKPKAHIEIILLSRISFIMSYHKLPEVQNALPLAVKTSLSLLAAFSMMVQLDAEVSDVIPDRRLHHTLQFHLQRWPNNDPEKP